MCGFNCTLTRADISQPRNTWGCPCGVGYWDEIKKEFVTGDRVRSGEVRSRDQYLAHLQECSQCRDQARLDGLDPVSVDPNLQRYWIPEGDIDLGIFSENIKSYLGDKAFVLPGVNPNDGRVGYLIRANAAPTREMLSNLKYLTKQNNPIAQTSVSTFKSEQSPSVAKPLRRDTSQSTTRANPATTENIESRYQQPTRSFHQQTTSSPDPASQFPSQAPLVSRTSPRSSSQTPASNPLYQSPGIQDPLIPSVKYLAQVGAQSLASEPGAQLAHSASPYQITAPEYSGQQFYQQGQGVDSQTLEHAYSTDSYQSPLSNVAAQQPYPQSLGLSPQHSSPSQLPTGYQSTTPSYQHSWSVSSQQPSLYSAASYQEPTLESQSPQTYQQNPHVGQQESSDDSQSIANAMKNLGLDEPNVDNAQGERGDYHQRSGFEQQAPQHRTPSQELHQRLSSSGQQSQHQRTSRTQDRHQRRSGSEQQGEEDSSARSQEPRGGARDRKGRDKHGRH